MPTIWGEVQSAPLIERIRRPRSPATTTTPSPIATALRVTGGSSLGNRGAVAVQVWPPSRLRQHMLRSQVAMKVMAAPTFPNTTARRFAAIIVFEGVQRLPSLLVRTGPAAPTATQTPFP